jgi:hypothetical protein
MPALTRWKFDAGSGTSLANSVSPFGNTGTLTNPAAWSSDFPSAISGNAFSLNYAASYYATFPNVATLSPTASFSVSLWIKNNAIPGTRDSAFGIDYGLGEFAFDVGSSYDNDGVVAVDVGVAGSTYEPLKVASLAITDCVDDGAGLIKVTSNGHGLATGRTVYISGVLGTTEANSVSPQTITVVDANNFTLDGSTFANAYTSGGAILPRAPIGVWYHLAVVLRNGSADLYLDGVFQNTLTYGTTLSADPCTGPMTSGAAHFVGAPYLSFFNGLVDDIRTFDYELSGAEITDLAAGTGPGQGGGASAPLVSLSASTSSIAENGGAVTLIATMDATASDTVTIAVSFAGSAATGSDYTLSTTSIAIASGQTSGSLTATAISDSVYEGNEQFVASIGSVNGGGASASSTASTATVTIVDDEQGDVYLTSSATTVAEANASAVLVAVMNATASGTVNVVLGITGTATSGSDYSLGSSTISIASGNTSGSISFTSIQDTLDENNETAIVSIASISGAGSYSHASQPWTFTITDDDAAPTVTLSASATTISENAGTAYFLATLSAPSGRSASFTVNVGTGTATSGVDFTASTTSFFWPAGTTTASIGVTSLADILFESNETIVMLLSSPTNCSAGSPFSASMTIVNEYLAPFVSLSASTTSISENSGSATIVTTLDHTHSADVTVVVAFTGSATLNTDYSRTTNSIVIVSGASSGSISITALQESVGEANETVIVSISNVTNGTAASAASATTISIVDDDSRASGISGLHALSGLSGIC